MRQAQEKVARWQALGTTAVVALTDARAMPAARAAVQAELAAIDAACSRFRADSGLARVNAAAAAGGPAEAEPLLIEALAVALRAAEITDGDLDPCIGAAIEAAGYDRDWHLIARHGPGRSGETRAVRARRRGAYASVQIDRRAGTIRLPAGVRLDLGATAKAWAADRAARSAAEAAGGSGVLVALGGDIATAGPSPARGWRVHVSDDHRDDRGAGGQTVTIRSGGMATSSVTVRRWVLDGAPMHHIIDPDTSLPARSVWRTVSVAAADCTDANIASTAAILRSERAVAWLTQLGLPARLVRHDGTVTTVAGWPAEHSRPMRLAA